MPKTLAGAILIGALTGAFAWKASAQAASPILGLAAQMQGEHRVLTLDDGFDSFVLRVHLVRAAQATIDLQTFIWADDECSRYFEKELIKAAERGVKIRLLVDHMWSTKDPDRIAWNADHLGDIDIKLYRPMAKRLDPSLPRKIINILTPNGTNQRMHNKVMVVDGAVGLTGGRNIGNRYFDYSTTYNFKDRDLMVVGPIVEDMAASFDRYWNFKHAYATDELKDMARMLENGELETYRADVDLNTPYFQRLGERADDTPYLVDTFVAPATAVTDIEFVADEPGRKTLSYFFSPHGGGAMSEAMHKEFMQSEESILVQSPYVILNRRSRRTMRKAQKRAPDLEVRVSTNSFGAADHLETYSANYRLRSKVIRGLGFEVYEYKPNPGDLNVYLANFEELEQRAQLEGERRAPYLSIHSKTFVFDDRTAYIGTYNLDPRSFYINSECGVFVHDYAFVRDIRARVERDMAPENSWVIARKKYPLAEVNVHIEELSSWLPLDLWPVRHMSGFELKNGDDPVPPDHPEFYERYRDLGSFPGSDGISFETTLILIYKGIGKHATPLL
jgi:cardiolipin synthase C